MPANNTTICDYYNCDIFSCVVLAAGDVYVMTDMGRVLVFKRV